MDDDCTCGVVFEQRPKPAWHRELEAAVWVDDAPVA